MCYGLAGFVIGATLGIVIGLSCHKKEKINRYMQAIQCRYYAGIEV